MSELKSSSSIKTIYAEINYLQTQFYSHHVPIQVAFAQKILFFKKKSLIHKNQAHITVSQF